MRAFVCLAAWVASTGWSGQAGAVQLPASEASPGAPSGSAGSRGDSRPVAPADSTNPIDRLILRVHAREAGQPGDTVRYTIQVANPTELPVRGAQVHFDLPEGAAFVSADRGGQVDGSRIVWPRIPALGPGHLTAFTFRITVPSPSTSSAAEANSEPVGSTASGAPGSATASARGSAGFTAPSADGHTALPPPVQASLASPASPTAVAAAAPALADLRLTKTGPAAVNSQDTIVYQISLRNLGTASADNVVVTDQLPVGVEFIDATGGGVPDSTGLLILTEIARLGTDRTFTFTVRVRAPACATPFVVNRAEVTTTSAESDVSNNAAEVVTRVDGPSCGPDVELDLSGPTRVATGDTIPYTIRVTNRGIGPAHSVVVSDLLPAGVRFVDASDNVQPQARRLEWAPVDLDPGEYSEYRIRVVAPACPTVLEDLAEANLPGDPTPANNTGRLVTTVEGACRHADLVVSKVGAPSAFSDDTIAYSLKVWNRGPVAAEAVEIADTLPAGVRYLSATGNPAVTGSVLTWPVVSTLAPDDTVRLAVRVVVTSRACTLLRNVAAARSGVTEDPDLSNNRAVAETQTVVGSGCVGADVEIRKTASVLAADIGDEVRFRLVARNNGPDTAVSVVVTDSLPENPGFREADGAMRTGRLLEWPAIPRLAPGDSVTYEVVVDVTRPPSGSYTNVARVASASPIDPDPTNNRGQATVEVRLPVQLDLAVTKDTVGAFRRGGEGLFRIEVRNVGTSATTGPIMLTDSLPPDLTWESAQGEGWTFTGSGRVVVGGYAGTLPRDSTLTVDLLVRVSDSAETVCNVVWVATPGDSNGSNDRAEACVDLPPPPPPLPEAIDLEKSADRSSVVFGGLVEYALVVRSVGGAPLMEAGVTDRLPPGFRYEPGTVRRAGQPTVDPEQGPNGLLRFGLGALAAGDSVVLVYTARAGPGTPVGDAVNRAIAFYNGGTSPEAIAVVRVEQGVFVDEGMIAGTVFADSLAPVDGSCDCAFSDRVQRGEPGIPGVRVVLQDGTAAITDSEGRYLFTGLRPRTWVVKVDRSTLPDPELRFIRLSNRHSSDGGSVLVDLKKGELHRVDLAVAWSGVEARRIIEGRRAGADEASPEPWSSRPVGSTNRPTGLSAGIPWTRYVPLMPSSWTGGAYPTTGPLSAVIGFPKSPTGPLGTQATATEAAMPSEAPVAAGPAGATRSNGRPAELAIGLVEARLDVRSLSDTRLGGMGRDAFEDALLSLSSDDDDGRIHAGTRAAFLYEGQAAGRFDLTVRLDTEEDDNARLFRDITPDDFYPIYGDASAKDFGARSRSRFFARAGSGDSWIQWGDFNTGRAATGLAGDRSLGQYARTLNGALHHFESDRIAFDAFASRDRSAQVVDVIPAEGVSGPYRLSRSDALVNSERVELVTRLRDQPSIVLRTRVLERFTDYTIEPLTGRLVFRRPVPAFDEDLNPVEIRVAYEVEGDTDRFWVWGANARLRPISGFEIGGSLARDENPADPFELGSLNATVAVAGSTWLMGELARSGGSTQNEGDAARVELLHASDRIRLRGFWLTTDSTFDNPTTSYGAGRAELGLVGSARLGPGTHLFTELFSSEDRRLDRTRRGARVGVRQALGRWLTGEAGYRWASVDASGGVGGSDDIGAAGVRLQAALGGEAEEVSRGTAFAEVEQDVSETDRRRVAVGADVRVLDGVRLYGRHEFVNSLTGPWHLESGVDRNATVFGVATENRAGEATFSEYRVREAVDGREAEAAIGLRNAWQVGEGVRLSGSLERLTPLGPGRGDATALTAGAEFTGSATWKGSVRGEYQARDGSDNLFGSIGAVRRLSSEVSLLGNAVFSALLGGERAWSRARIGLAWREVDGNRWNGLARYEHRYERSEGAGSGRRWESTHVLAAHLDFQPAAGLLLRGQWTSRLTTERLGAGTTSARAHLAGARATADIAGPVDVGLIGRSQFDGGFGSARYGVGVEAGLRLPGDLRLAAGYNVFGFRDDTPGSDEYTDRGAYVQLAFRFDEGLWRGSRPAAGECGCDRRDNPPGRVEPPEPPEPLEVPEVPDTLPGPTIQLPPVPPIPKPGPTVGPPLWFFPDLAIGFVAPSRVLAGTQFDVEITAENVIHGGIPVDSVLGSATLGAGATFVSGVTLGDTPGELEFEERGSLEGGSRRSVRLRIRAPELARGAAVDSIVLDARLALRPNELVALNNQGRKVIRVLPWLAPIGGTVPITPRLPHPDLFVWIRGPDPVHQGDSIRYEFWTTNIGDQTATNVVSTVWMPDLDVLREDDGPVRMQTFHHSFDRSLAPGDTVKWSLTIRAPGQPAQLEVITRSDTDTPLDPLHNNEDRTVTAVPCVGRCDPALSLDVFGPPYATLGDTVRYRVGTYNPGTVRLNSVGINAHLETGGEIIAASSDAGLVGTGWLTDIGSGERQEEWVDVVCSAPIITVTAEATANGPAPRVVQRTTECVPTNLDVRIVPRDSEPRYPGDLVTWDIVTRNLGPGRARFVRRSAVLPADGTLDLASGGGTPSDGDVRWPVLDSLRSGRADTVSLAVRAPATWVPELRLEAEASTTTPDSDPSNNRDDDTAFLDPIIEPDPTIDLAVDIAPDSVRGHTVYYRVTVENVGSATAHGVRIGATWPARVALVSASRGAVEIRDTLVWPTLPAVPAGLGIVENLVVIMPAAPDSVELEAFASANVQEVVTDNNTDRTAAIMIQEVIIRDPVPVGPRLIDWLLWLLPWLLVVLLLVLIAWIVWWLGWPPRDGGDGNGKKPDEGGTRPEKGRNGGEKERPAREDEEQEEAEKKEKEQKEKEKEKKKHRVVTDPGGESHTDDEDDHEPWSSHPIVEPPTPRLSAIPFSLPRVPVPSDLDRACGPIEVEGNRGTAYVVQGGWLVTCSHVVLNRRRGDRVSVKLGERIVEALIQAVDPRTDLAILRPLASLTGITPLELAPEEPVPAWWRGYGYPGGPEGEGVAFGGALLQTAAHDRFRSGVMTLTGPGIAVRLLEPGNGLAGSPILVNGRVAGHIRGPVPHPDTLTKSLAHLVQAVPASRILELIHRIGDETASRRPEAEPTAVDADPPHPVQWSIAPGLSDCDTDARHASILYRPPDAAFTQRLATRLEGAGFRVQLRRREGSVPAGFGTGSGARFVVHSKAWSDASVAALDGGPPPVILRVDDTPLPESWQQSEQIDFCGVPADTGEGIRAVIRRLAGVEEGDHSGVGMIHEIARIVDHAIDTVRSARGRPKRTQFAVKRWKECGIPDSSPVLLAAEQLLETGWPAQALEALDGILECPRKLEIVAAAQEALGRIGAAIEALEPLVAAGGTDTGTVIRLAALCERHWIEGGKRGVAWIRKAFELASGAYHGSRDVRAAMDAARHALGSDELDEAILLANEVRETLQGRVAVGFDDHALAGEASLLLGDDAIALESLARAVAASPGDDAAIGALHGRARRIADAVHSSDAARLALLEERFAELFYLPKVAALAGDQPSELSETSVRAELRAVLEARDVGVAVCCPDTLAALILAEETLRRGGTVQAVLPLPVDLFVATRVAGYATGRVRAVLADERTRISEPGRSGREAESGGAEVNAQQLADAILEVAGRAASARSQHPLVFGAEESSGTGIEYPFDPVGRQVEQVRLSCLSVPPPEDVEEPAAGSGGQAPEPEAVTRQAPVSQTRDLKRVRRRRPDDPIDPGGYSNLYCVAIGINEYTEWNPLKNAVNDATGVARLLAEEFGFETRILTNAEATRERIRSVVLDELHGKLKKDDLLIVFFAGHGHTERLTDDEEHGFLVPVDARRDVLDDLLRMEEVVSWTERLDCEDVLYIFDSCFSGFAAFAGGMTKRGESDDARVAISSGSAEQPVLDGGAPAGYEDHSIFTANLLLLLTKAVEEASSEDGLVDTMRLYVDLRDRVTRATARKQTPVWGFLQGHGAGEIWLAVREAEGT